MNSNDDHKCQCFPEAPEYDRRMANDVQVEISEKIGDLKVLMARHLSNMEHIGAVAAENHKWITDARPHVAKWVDRDKQLAKVKVVLVAALFTAAAAQWMGPVWTAVQSWLA